MPEKLNKCPFCGGSAGTGHTGGFENQHLIYCFDCGVTMSGDSVSHVVARWNYRPQIKETEFKTVGNNSVPKMIIGDCYD